MLYEPYVIESIGRGPEKSYGLFSRLLKERVILLSGEIVEDTATVVCSQLLYLESQEPEKPIFLYINSPGGSVTAGLAIYDIMNYISCPVYTVCLGEACSMGSFLLTAGTKRYSLPNSSLMYHSVSSGFAGTIQDHEIAFKETKRLQELLISTIVQKCSGKIELEVLKDKVSRDWWLTPQEALEFGLIDKVIINRGEV